eukprot:scaffold83474_cov47-Prasinocladus_malaysianus.AAC.2
MAIMVLTTTPDASTTASMAHSRRVNSLTLAARLIDTCTNFLMGSVGFGSMLYSSDASIQPRQNTASSRCRRGLGPPSLTACSHAAALLFSLACSL